MRNILRGGILLLGLAAAACGSPGTTTPTSPHEATIPPAQTAPAEATIPLAAATPTPDPYAELRQWMVDRQIASRGVKNEAVLEAMRRVPRHRFVPDEHISQAYADHPLPIGFGQTISQPYIVALMTEMLDPQPTDVILEVGTGSGYQAAVLAELVEHVYTVEIIPDLAETAEQRLRDLGYTNVTVANLDGYYGWEAYALFDKIIVTAAPDHIPPALIEQLKEGGRLVIPVGPQGLGQILWLVEKMNGEIQTTNYGAVRFVPLTGGNTSP